MELHFSQIQLSKLKQHFEQEEHYHQIIGVLAAIPPELIYSNRPLRHKDCGFSIFYRQLDFQLEYFITYSRKYEKL